MDLEPGGAISIGSLPLDADNDNAYKEFSWLAVSNDTDYNFLVLQTGTEVQFYDLGISPLSNGLKSFTLNMATYLAPNATLAEAALCELHFAAGKGYLFVSGEKFEPVIVSYDKQTDTITSERITILMRDFVGLQDGLAPDAEPLTLSVEHNYNLLNQGWVTPSANAGGTQLAYDSFGKPISQGSPGQQPITDFFASRARYPGNNKQWWVARDSTTNAFKPDLLDTFFYGASRAPRGHFVLNAFSKDRGAVSGLAGITIESTDNRPTANAFMSGRAWWIAESNVYFSQVLDDKNKAGMCFQEADPTSEAVSDLIATDGGVIPIPEMGKALRAFPAAGGLLIFANNGIWYVGGGQGGFSALDLSVTKVSPIGTESPNSIVDTKDGIFWFDKVGVRGMQVQTGAGGTSFDIKTISEQTIQTYIQDALPRVNLPYVKGAYDTRTNTIQWVFNSVADDKPYLYDTVLNLDLTLGSFYPFTIDPAGPRLIGLFTTQDANPINSPFVTSIREQTFKYRTLVPGPTVYNFAFTYFRDPTFVDFKTLGLNTSYLSFLESGYELMDDAMRDKEMNYVFVYFRRTEENWVDDEPDFPSSCYMQIKWDWSSSSVSNKWTNKQQVYRHQRQPLYDDTNVFDTGFPIVVSKNKVRGHGRAIQFRFESTGPGHDFDLLGWAVPYSGNTNP